MLKLVAYTTKSDMPRGWY